MTKEKLKTVEDVEKETAVKNEPVVEAVNAEPVPAKEAGTGTTAKKTVEKSQTFKIMTPEPRTFVSFHDGTSVWSDENGIIRVTDKETCDFLLTYAGFKLIPEE
ncbi:hypothetical protein [Listeria booriae]|uniref:hypothetical protein n=1 Tax=Listeria booriae TaxID=1552123 RepID=UPI00162A72F9|nr:hypothetical protein [Listeria booriae]MBC1524450.1 hypothetical protein [Listeria booriae]MBC6306428.1 hypothetical protein [Listeria booriae]